MKRVRLLCVELDRGQAWRLTQLLSQRYDVELLELDGIRRLPDLLFYGYTRGVAPVAGKLGRIDCLRVAVIFENIKPDFRFFDYAFSFEETDDKNFQFPFFCNSTFFEQFRTGCYGSEVQGFRKHPKDRFCNFVHSHSKSAQRAAIVRKLTAYKQVDCPGITFNNVPSIGPGPRNKINFIKRHKFTIAFENQVAPNYVTEKIFEALLVNSVPIYWGSPRIAEYFNPEAFINCHDYDNLDQVVDRVIEVDNDDELYQRYVNAAPVLEGSRAYAASEEAIVQRLEKIVNHIGTVPPPPVATTAVYKLRLPLYRLIYGVLGFLYPVRAVYLQWKWGLHLKKGFRALFVKGAK